MLTIAKTTLANGIKRSRTLTLVDPTRKLHTGVMYFSGGQAESFAAVSGSLQHDAVATWAHLDLVLDHITASQPLAKNIHFL